MSGGEMNIVSGTMIWKLSEVHLSQLTAVPVGDLALPSYDDCSRLAAKFGVEFQLFCRLAQMQWCLVTCQSIWALFRKGGGEDGVCNLQCIPHSYGTKMCNTYVSKPNTMQRPSLCQPASMYECQLMCTWARTSISPWICFTEDHHVKRTCTFSWSLFLKSLPPDLQYMYPIKTFKHQPLWYVSGGGGVGHNQTFGYK